MKIIVHCEKDPKGDRIGKASVCVCVGGAAGGTATKRMIREGL